MGLWQPFLGFDGRGGEGAGAAQDPAVLGLEGVELPFFTVAGVVPGFVLVTLCQ